MIVGEGGDDAVMVIWNTDPMSVIRNDCSP